MKITKLLKNFKKKKFGPFPSSSPIDVIRAMWLLETRIGRTRLAKEMDLGEWSTRNILKFLKANGLAEGAPMGYKLTRQGASCLNEIKLDVVGIKQIPASLLTMNKKGTGAQLRISRKIRNILSLRDEAVRIGAYGATMVEFKNNNFYFLDSDKKIPNEYDKILNKIKSIFTLKEYDKLILCYGEDKKSNERALWNLLLKILK